MLKRLISDAKQLCLFDFSFYNIYLNPIPWISSILSPYFITKEFTTLASLIPAHTCLFRFPEPPQNFNYIVVFSIFRSGFSISLPQNVAQFNTSAISMCNNFCWNWGIEETLVRIFQRSLILPRSLVKKDISTGIRKSCWI